MAVYSEKSFLSGLISALVVRAKPSQLTDFEFYLTGDGKYCLTGWKGTLNGKPSEVCAIPNSPDIILDLREGS